MQPLLQIRKLHPLASIPQYQSQLAAGLDVAACLPDGDLVLAPGTIALLKTGISMAIPAGYEAQIRPRS
jgi:dUTP pyrophosphatase